MQKGLVSVVIPNYNYAQYLSEAINSVLDQTYPDVEIIVVDDGSSDASKEILLSYGNRIETVLQQNQGVAAARNNGVKASSGEFIAFLDADDLWGAEKTEKQVNCFRNDEKLGLVHVGVSEIDSNGNSIGDKLEGGEGKMWQELLLFSGKGILGGGSGVMMPRTIFDEVGGFDERLSTSADWDLYFQISSRFEVGFVREPLLKYRVHNSNMHANIDVMERDMTLAFEKAFHPESPDLSAIKRRAFGSLHQNLAGSYFVARDYLPFIKHSLWSLAFNPGNIIHFLKIPKSRTGR
ncbi:hypothetical protein BH10ACI3_BH10ACI3_21940 [soil metagenome]